MLYLLRILYWTQIFSYTLALIYFCSQLIIRYDIEFVYPMRPLIFDLFLLYTLIYWVLALVYSTVDIVSIDLCTSSSILPLLSSLSMLFLSVSFILLTLWVLAWLGVLDLYPLSLVFDCSYLPILSSSVEKFIIVAYAELYFSMLLFNFLFITSWALLKFLAVISIAFIFINVSSNCSWILVSWLKC